MANQIRYQVGFDVQKASLNQLKSSLQQLQKLKWSDVMKINDSDISSAKKALEDIRREAGNVQDALKEAFNTKLNTVNIETFNRSLKNSGSSIQQIYKAFNNAGAAGEAAFRNLSTQVLSTNIQLKESHNLLDKMATTLGNTIKWNAASAVVNSFSRSIEQAWGYVKSLDSSLNDIRIVTGKSSEEMGRFAQQANKAAKELGKTTTDYTNAALIYAQQGLSDQEIEARAKITLKAANVTGQSTDEVSEQLTAVWNGYKVTAEEAELYVDRLAAVAAITASDLEELSTGMSKVASAAAAMGVGEDQLAAQLSTIISVTKQAPESVGTALRTVYARISDIKAGIDEDGVTLGNYSGKMAELGINVLDASGQLRDMGEVMEEIGGRWGDLTREQQIYLAQTMAGQRQYNNLLALFDNFEQYNKALVTAQGAAGTLQEQQDIYMESTAAHLDVLKTSIEDIYDSLINTDSINELVDGLSTAATFVADFVDGLGGGEAVLRSLGSIALTIFSDQIGKSLVTTINNLETAKQQAEYFKNAIAQAENLQNKGLGNDYTQFLIGQQESLLKMGGRLSPNDFNAIQQKLIQLSQTSGNIDIIEEKIELLGKGFNSLGGNLDQFAAEWGTLDDALASADGVEEIKKSLKNLETSFDPVINKQKEAREAFKNMYRDIQNGSPNAAQSFDNLKIKLQDFIGTLKTATIEKGGETLFNSLPENARKAVDQASKELKNLDFSQIGNPQQASNKITQIFSTLNQTINSEISKIQQAIKSADSGELEGLKQKLESLYAMQRQVEGEYDVMREKANRTIKTQDLASLAGGIAQVGSAIQQIQNLGSIWKNQDLSFGQQLLQTVTNLAISLPMLATGFSKVNTALKLFSLATAESVAATGASTVANSTHAISFGIVGGAAQAAGLQIKLFNHVLTISPWAAAALAIGGLITAFVTVKQKAEEARQAQIDYNNEIIENDKQKQQELQGNKKLYESLEDLDEQYRNHEITKGQLKSAAQSLIEQYGLEGQAIDGLSGSYENLIKWMDEKKRKDLEQAKNSAQEAYNAAKDNFALNTEQADYINGVETSFDASKNRLQITVNNANDAEGNFNSALTEKLNELFAAGTLEGKIQPNQLTLYTSGDISSMQGFSEIISELLESSKDSDGNYFYENGDQTLTSQWLQSLEQWRNLAEQQWAALDQSAKNAKKATENYNAFLASQEIKSKREFSSSRKVESYQDYMALRADLNEELYFNQGMKDPIERAKNVNSYIQENYSKLWDQYQQRADYNEDLQKMAQAQKNTEQFSNQLRNTIGELSNQQFYTLQNAVQLNPSVLSSWESFGQLVHYIAEQDLSNISQPISNVEDIQKITLDKFNTYQSVQSSVTDGKNISKEQLESLEPSIQSFFGLMADGTYKMVGDAKKFYEEINNLKLSGFQQAMQQIETMQANAKTLEKIDYQSINQNAFDVASAFEAPSIGIDGKKDAFNQNLFGISTDSIVLNTIEEQLKYLDVISQDSVQLQGIVQAWQQQLQEASSSGNVQALESMAEQVAQAVQDAGDQTGLFSEQLKFCEDALFQNQLALARTADSIETLKEYLDEGIISQQAYTQAALELDRALDTKNLDPEKLADYSDHLQEIATSSEELSDQLQENDEAARIVAKGIMKMNDAVEVLSKNWENWQDILKNSSETSEEYADAMGSTRETVADLLDISKDYVSEDFIKQHLDEIADAAQGSEKAIDGLKQSLATEIALRIVTENNLSEDLQSQLLDEVAYLQTILPDLEVGATLDDKDFIAKANKLIEDCGMTVDQANALFDAIGFEANFATQPQEVTQRVPKTVTRTTVEGYISGSSTDPHGEKVTWQYPNLEQHTYTDGYIEAKGTIDVPAMSTNRKSPVINSITRKGGGSFNNSSSSNKSGKSSGSSSSSGSSPKKSGGSGGKGSGGGKGSAPSPDTSQKELKEQVEDTRDIYHDINIELEQINRELERAQKKQDRLYGKQLLDNLNKQTQLLEKQKAKLKEKQALQQQDLKNQKQILKNLGVTFDQYGHISNYMSILGAKQAEINAKTAQYNSLIKAYNEFTNKEAKQKIAEQAEAINKQIQQADKEYKNLESKIKDYDDLRNDMEDLVDQIEEATQKQIELNIKKFRMQVEIRLELGEAERDWNKFRRNVLEKTDIIKDTDFDKIFGDALRDSRDLSSYFNVRGSKGSLEALTEQILATKKQIDDIDKTGTSAIYGDNKAQAMQDLQADLKELMDQMQDIQSLIDSIDEAYLDTIDDISEQFDKQIEDYEYIQDLIQHDMDLLTLLYGDKNYDAMDKYYETLEKNNLKQLDSLKKQKDFWKQQWDAAVARGDTQAAKKFEQNYKDTIKKLNQTIEEAAKNIQDKYTNSINKIFDELDKKVSGGKGTDYLDMQWQLMNKNADEYLDTINSAFAIQQTQRKYQNALNDTKSIKNQQALKNLMDEQLDILKNKEKITQYDVDRAEKLLQVEQARIALEEAQSAKTSLRLKRDSQGNYSYEYVADQGAMGEAQADLAAAQNDLYNFDKDRYQSNLNDMLSAWKDFQSRYKEILLDTSLSEQQRVEKTALLREQYGQYINDKTAENLVVRNNLMESAFADLAALYQTDVSNYNQMSIDEKKILMEDLVPAWGSGIQAMSDKVAGEGGFIPTCQDAFGKVSEKTKEYQKQLGEMADAAGVDLGQVKTGVDETAESLGQVIQDNGELIRTTTEEMNAISKLREEASKLKIEYGAVYKAAQMAVTAINAYVQAQRSAAAAAAAAYSAASSGSYSSPSYSSSSSPSNASGGSGVKGNGSNPSGGSSPTGGSGNPSSGADSSKVHVSTSWENNKATTVRWYYDKNGKIVKLAGGGYTGSWGSEGKLAVLHEKELVLNKSDTKNILDSVNILRSFIGAVDGDLYSRLGALSIRNPNFNNGSSNSVEQSVHIEASFPNVNSKREIEQAFNDLINLAAQRAMKNK